MKIEGEARRVRVYIGESDQWHHRSAWGLARAPVSTTKQFIDARDCLLGLRADGWWHATVVRRE